MKALCTPLAEKMKQQCPDEMLKFILDGQAIEVVIDGKKYILSRKRKK